jgi:ABC-type polysaccharide/polyol phosphate transport system ATPase subunit
MDLPNLFPLIKIQTSISIKAINTQVIKIQMEIMGLTFKIIKTIYKGIITFPILTEENNNK